MTVASQVKQALSELKGVQGTLRLYTTQTQDEETVTAFNDAVDITKDVINDLERRLQVLEFQEPQYKGN